MEFFEVDFDESFIGRVSKATNVKSIKVKANEDPPIYDGTYWPKCSDWPINREC